MIKPFKTFPDWLVPACQRAARVEATKEFREMLAAMHSKYISLAGLVLWIFNTRYTDKSAMTMLNQVHTEYFWEATTAERKMTINNIMKHIGIDAPVKFVGRTESKQPFFIFH